MSAKILLDFIKYTPEDTDIILLIKTDDKSLDQSVRYSAKDTVKSEINNFRKEMRFYIRVQKQGITLGNTEFGISQLTLLKREELIQKTLNIIGLDKKTVVSKLTVKIRIIYCDSDLLNKTSDTIVKEVQRSSSALSLESRGHSSLSFTTDKKESSKENNFLPKNYNNNLNHVPTKKTYSIKNMNGSSNISSPNSKKLLTDKKISEININNKSEDNDKDKSRIETLFDDDKISRIENLGKNLENFICDFRLRYKEGFEENPEDTTIEGFQRIMNQLFELQEIYHENFEKGSFLNAVLKSFFISYNENYRNLNKKNNRINEALEIMHLKKDFSENINRNDNQRILQSIDLHLKEIKIYKNILKINYGQKLIDKYKEDLRTEKCKFYF